ncbi:hypothetical protein, partial [Mesomycoplasma ovipneumoniae]|uniref:hypothetical protein n=1 Tax=Mesomycoplasma ovipneumoniae TaxID=29562 RepID=UPI003CC7E9A3
FQPLCDFLKYRVHLAVFPPWSAEQACEKRDERSTDQGDTAACHQLIHALGLSARIVVAVTFHEVDHTPDTEACTECDYECLKYAYCAVEKCHIFCETNGIFYPGQLHRYPASLVSFLHSFVCLQLPCGLPAAISLIGALGL